MHIITYNLLYSIYVFMESKISIKYTRINPQNYSVKYYLLSNLIAILSKFYKIKDKDLNNFLYNNESYFLNNLIVQHSILSIDIIEKILFNQSKNYHFSLKSFFCNSFFNSKENYQKFEELFLNNIKEHQYIKQSKIVILLRFLVSNTNNALFIENIYTIYALFMQSKHTSPILDDENRLLLISILSNQNTSYTVLRRMIVDFPSYEKLLKKHVNFNKSSKSILNLILQD